MKIYGLKKVTLIDYPEHIACTVFTHGCTLRCPFCHNPELVIKQPNDRDSMDTSELLTFLQQRKGKLDGVVLTGGEPLVHDEEIAELCADIHRLGFLVKVDTNGTFPEELSRLIHKHLVDFVAMDFKTHPDYYSRMSATQDQVKAVLTSLQILKENQTEYEIRTTLVPGIHTPALLGDMMPYLDQVTTYVLQNFTPNGLIDQSFSTTQPFSPEEMKTFLAIAQKHNPNSRLRLES